MQKYIDAYNAYQGNLDFIFIGGLIITLSVFAYELYEFKDVKDADAHNRKVYAFSRMILLGILFNLLGVLSLFISAIAFMVIGTILAVAFAVTFVFVDKLPIWEER